MDKPFFSIIIPTLNEAKRIPQILKMFENQVEKSFEVIFVDAKSEDDTKEITFKIKTNFTLVFTESTKRSPGFQRNLGAKKASGKYLVFFDADTQISPDFLRLIKYKLGISNPDFASTRMVPDTKVWLDHVLTFVSNFFMICLTKLGYPYMSASNLIFKTDVYDKLAGFDETVILSDDHELVQRAAKMGYKGQIFYHPTHVFSFRRFEREGRLTVAKKYAKALVHMLFKGPIRQPIYEYKMGGKPR